MTDGEPSSDHIGAVTFYVSEYGTQAVIYALKKGLISLDEIELP
jgi:hypothetical protein